MAHDIWTCGGCETVNQGCSTCVVCQAPASGRIRPSEPAPQPTPAPVPGPGAIGPSVRDERTEPIDAAPEPRHHSVDPAASAPAPNPTRRALVTIAVVLVVLALAGAFELATRSPDDRSAQQASVAEGDSDPGDDTAFEDPTSDLSDDTSAPVATDPPATTAPPIAAGPTADLPLTGRTWVAMRSSLKDERAANGLAATIPGAYVFFTNSWASLTPDYWVVAVGRYGSAEEALGYCRSNGLYRAHDCVALPVSQDPGDQQIRPSLEGP